MSLSDKEGPHATTYLSNHALLSHPQCRRRPILSLDTSACCRSLLLQIPMGPWGSLLCPQRQEDVVSPAALLECEYILGPFPDLTVQPLTSWLLIKNHSRRVALWLRIKARTV